MATIRFDKCGPTQEMLDDCIFTDCFAADAFRREFDVEKIASAYGIPPHVLRGEPEAEQSLIDAVEEVIAEHVTPSKEISASTFKSFLDSLREPEADTPVTVERRD